MKVWIAKNEKLYSAYDGFMDYRKVSPLKMQYYLSDSLSWTGSILRIRFRETLYELLIWDFSLTRFTYKF